MKKQITKPLFTIITDWYWPNQGGMETLTQTLASRISKYFEVQILTHPASNQKTLYKTYTTDLPLPQTDPTGNAIQYLRPRLFEKLLLIPLRIREIPKIGKLVLVYDLLYVFYRVVFYSRIKKHLTSPSRTSLVHCFSTGYLARCVTEGCLELGIPLVHSPSVHFGRWGDSPAQMRAYIGADVITFQTESFKRVFLSKVILPLSCSPKVIPPLCDELDSSDTSQFNSENFILFLGRREKHKGLPMVLEAVAQMNHRIQLVVAGPGKQISSKVLGVTDLGAVDEPTKGNLLKKCVLLCVPSTDETFGIVYTEAMSCSKPIVALDIPPINEIIENEVTGILVPPGDVKALTKALDRIVSDRELAKQLGEEAFKRFTKYYSGEKIWRDLEKMYRGLIEGNRNVVELHN